MPELVLHRSEAGVLKYEFWERENGHLKFLMAVCPEMLERWAEMPKLREGETRRVKRVRIELEPIQ